MNPPRLSAAASIFREMSGSTAISRTYLRVLPWALVLAAGAAAAFFAWRAPPNGTRPSPRATGPDAPRVGADIPKIDVHVHVAPRLAARAVELLGAQGIAVALNASGGAPGQGLELSEESAEHTGGRLLYYCNLSFAGVESPEWGTYVRETLEGCKQRGARGLKISKALGLGIRLSDGSLLAVDDARLDPVFETCADLSLPVLIHSGDPVAFFQPNGPENPRREELAAHPEWSFHGEYAPGRPWPSWEQIYTQFERRVLRHPRTKFLGAHFGNAPEDPRRVAALLERAPNFHIDTAARLPEIGRRPAAEMRAFFVKWQDRILFGSDTAITPDGLTLGSRGEDHDRPENLPAFFLTHWRYFETDEARLPSPTPIQGRAPIDGIGLPRTVLEKLYHANAERLFAITLPGGDAGR
jgi:hypothetical protein